MKPEEELLVAICRQAAEDYRAAFDELGIARLMGDKPRSDMWAARFKEAGDFFRNGTCREICNGNDAVILAGLEAELNVKRNWMLFKTWDEALEAWRAYAKENHASLNRTAEKKQMRAWLVRKCG